MGKVALLLPGQGSQKVGMGADLKETKPDVFDCYFAQAAAATGMPRSLLKMGNPHASLGG